MRREERRAEERRGVDKRRKREKRREEENPPCVNQLLIDCSGVHYLISFINTLSSYEIEAP